MDKIQCPNCGHYFQISETLFSDLEQKLKSKFEEQSEVLKISAATDKKKLKEELLKEKKDFIKGIEDETVGRLEEEFKLKSDFVEEQLQTTNKKYLESQSKIQKLLLDAENNNQYLEEERTRLLEEHNRSKKELEAEIQTKVDEEHRLKTLERDKIIQDQQTKLLEMQRKLEQGSQQTQGEVLELDIESRLQVKYPQDDTIEVLKGIKGADIIQVVKNNLLQTCGKIIVEVKNVKLFSKKFIDKIKDDKREANADIAIILTTTLPQGIKYFSIIDGVMVADYSSFFNLIDIFRDKLIDLYGVKASNQNRANKIELLYDHVTNPKFFEKIKTLYDLYSNMKASLDSERNSVRRHWNKRETELEILVSNVNDVWSGLNAITNSFPDDI